MATKKKTKSTTSKPASKKQAGLTAMLRALETEIEKQREAIDVAQQRLRNLQEDRDTLRKRIEEAEG